MKNISIHSLIGLTVLCMSSCTDDYTDWATPQANEQEAAITLPDFSASKVDDINLSNPGSSIKLFTLSNATLPEGYTLGNVRVELSTEKGKAGELESNTDGMIDSLTIQKLGSGNLRETSYSASLHCPSICQCHKRRTSLIGKCRFV